MDFKNRSSGVLMHVSSLPGPFGTGVLGQEAREFIDNIKNMGFSVWQILPLNIPDKYNSPYSSVSAFAGNFMLIDPRELFEIGLIDRNELDSCIYNGQPYSADYNYAKERCLNILKIAFSRIDETIRENINKFIKMNEWVFPFSLFMSVKESMGNSHWWEWENGFSNYEICKAHSRQFNDDIDFWSFTQYIFYNQWQTIKNYANEKGVKILGDMPFYVSRDSVDVWQNPALFKLDKLYCPSCVAGVPPDYFSCEGQLWGNPIYNWEAIEKDNFSWWVSRFRFLLSIYDIVRIDHFRALSSYWSIPFTSETAANGKWVKGPGEKFFDTLREEIKDYNIIAEDLGGFEKEVSSLLKYAKLPGMRVVQFGFCEDGDNKNLPHNYNENTIAYIGTHDNSTLLGWLWSSSEIERQYALSYCGFKDEDWGLGGFNSPSCRCIIETVWKTNSKLCIIPIQDMCGFGDDARMNTPGVCSNNWAFRITADNLNRIDKDYFLNINRLFKRC